MNDKITETDLLLWADGQLDPARLTLVEAHLKENPGLRLELEEMRTLTSALKREVPASVEPPYPDFFNSRILRDIQENAAPVSARKTPFLERFKWLALPASLAALALAFFAGTRISDPAAPGPVAQNSDPVPSLYLPTDQMQAEVFSGDHGEINLIVLDGLTAIPDENELARDFNSTDSQVQFVSHRREFF